MLSSHSTSSWHNAHARRLRDTPQHIRNIGDVDQTKIDMDEAKLLQQLGGIRTCLEILKKSELDRVNVFENIDKSEDSGVIMVLTTRDAIRGTNITIGARAISLMGQKGDESLQKGVKSFCLSVQSTLHNMAGQMSTRAFEQRHGSGQIM
jgi:hypothetical protein